MIRLFVAINFNSDTRLRLISIQNELRNRSQRGNFTLPENLHLTLAFIGDVSPRKIDKIKAILETVTFEPFDVLIERIGTFSRGTLWWAGLRKDEQLMLLQREIEHKLALCGFEPDGREYSPHVTLGREVVTAAAPWKVEPFGEIVSHIDLMKSERIGGKLTYTSIYRRGKRKSPIIIEPYSPTWASEFERIEAYLMPHIGDLIVDIHHIGSTSVPGLSAKPIIDFDIEIATMSVFPAIKERLGKLNFRHEGDYGITGREAFKREVLDEFMSYHMYVCPSDSAEFRRHLRFRDALRADARIAAEYAALKTALAEKCGNDIDAYIAGKAGFINNILERKGDNG